MAQVLSMLSLCGVATVGSVIELPRAVARRQQEERLTRPAEVEEQTKKSSEECETARENLETAYRRVLEDFKEAKDRSNLDAGLRETRRVTSLYAYLVQVRKHGERVIADEATLKAAFDQLQKASADAVIHFEDSAAIFRRHVEKAKFAETKATYQKFVDWYDARAKQAKHEAKLDPMLDYDTEHEKLAEFVDSLRILEETVKRDPASFRERPKGYEDLIAFEAHYRNLGEVIAKNTAEILKGLPN
jgi:hypothetical protein